MYDIIKVKTSVYLCAFFRRSDSRRRVFQPYGISRRIRKDMKMKKTMMKVGILISLCNGLVLGSVFSSIGMIRSPQGRIMPMGVVTSALLSAVISIIVGLMIPMKSVTDKVHMKLGIDPARQKAPAWFVEGVVGDLIFTPILCTFFIIMNRVQGRIDPHAPIFMVWLKELGLDLLVALPITMVIVPLVRKLAFKIFGAGGAPEGKGEEKEKEKEKEEA